MDENTKSLSMHPNARHERLIEAKRSDARANEVAILAKLRSENWAIEPTSTGWVATNRL